MNVLQKIRRAPVYIWYIVLFILLLFFPLKSYLVILSYGGLTVFLLVFFHANAAAVLGNLFYGRGKPDMAAALYRFAVKRRTTRPTAYVYYATYLLRRGAVDEAAELLEKALRLNPGNILVQKNIRLTQASCQWVLGNIDAAIEILENMRKTFDYVNAHVLSTLGYMYFLKDDMERSEALSRSAIEENPESYAAWDNIGQIFYKQKNLPKAKEALYKAVEIRDDLPDSLYYLGLIARDEGEEEKARGYFNQALGCRITPLSTVKKEQIEEALQKNNRF